MSKRFTDTDKWKKPFIRGLQGAYKLLWLYILDDCDHAGIWQVDFEVASIRIGEEINADMAVEIFGDRIEIFHAGAKWFIKDFVVFQYGELTERNRLHVSVIKILKENEVGAYKPLTRGQGQEQGNGQGQGTRQGKGKLEIFQEIFEDEIFLENLSRTHKGKDLKQAFEECYIHHSNAPNPPAELSEWKQKLNTWLTIKKIDKVNGKSKFDPQATLDRLNSYGKRPG